MIEVGADHRDGVFAAPFGQLCSGGIEFPLRIGEVSDVADGEDFGMIVDREIGGDEEMPFGVDREAQTLGERSGADPPGEDHELEIEDVSVIQYDLFFAHFADAVVVPDVHPQLLEPLVRTADQKRVHAVEDALVRVDEVDVHPAAAEVAVAVEVVRIRRHLRGDFDSRKPRTADDDVERLDVAPLPLRFDPLKQGAFELLFEIERAGDAFDAVGVFAQTRNERGEIGTAPRGDDEVVVAYFAGGGAYPVSFGVDVLHLFADKFDVSEAFHQRGEVDHDAGHVDFVGDEVVDFGLHVMVGVLIDQGDVDFRTFAEVFDGADTAVTAADHRDMNFLHSAPLKYLWNGSGFRSHSQPLRYNLPINKD